MCSFLGRGWLSHKTEANGSTGTGHGWGGAMFYLKSFNHITPSNPGTHGTRRPGRLSPLNTVGPCVPGSVFISAPFLVGEGLGQAERPAYPVKR